jgi:hypothetical protein
MTASEPHSLSHQSSHSQRKLSSPALRITNATHDGRPVTVILKTPFPPRKEGETRSDATWFQDELQHGGVGLSIKLGLAKR